jgi:hypothetical protein
MRTVAWLDSQIGCVREEIMMARLIALLAALVFVTGIGVAEAVPAHAGCPCCEESDC